MLARRLPSAAPLRRSLFRAPAASFHSSRPAQVKVGDSIPDVELAEGSPGNKVNIAKELKQKGIIVGKLIRPVLTESLFAGRLELFSHGWHYLLTSCSHYWLGVPAAFSPGCSQSHVPGYINSPKLKDAGPVFVVSVNDAFVSVHLANCFTSP